MNLYLISQDINNDWDTYDSAVVCANSKKEARMIHPAEYEKNWDGKSGEYDSWCDAKDVKVIQIGIALKKLKRGVVCASFNAG